jgi:hypothetical protein
MRSIARILVITNSNKINQKRISDKFSLYLLSRNASSTQQQIEKIDPEAAVKLPSLLKKARSRGEPRDFVDFIKVKCRAGNGGDGMISFLREKNIEFGEFFE